MKKVAIIVAGGAGLRMGSEIPKQFLLLDGKPVLLHTLLAFQQALPEIQLIVVLPINQIAYWMKLCAEREDVPAHEVVSGGETRFHSSLNGIGALAEENQALVAIHDGVRPLISAKEIVQAYEMAEHMGNAVLAIDSKDSIRIFNEENGFFETIDRKRVKIIQTPQVFQLQDLRQGFAQAYKSLFTDDASVMEQAGHRIHLSEGHPENIKITTPEDLLVAEGILKKRAHAASILG